jgi:hypothetical protein
MLVVALHLYWSSWSVFAWKDKFYLHKLLKNTALLYNSLKFVLKAQCAYFKKCMLMPNWCIIIEQSQIWSWLQKCLGHNFNFSLKGSESRDGLDFCWHAGVPRRFLNVVRCSCFSTKIFLHCLRLMQTSHRYSCPCKNLQKNSLRRYLWTLTNPSPFGISKIRYISVHNYEYILGSQCTSYLQQHKLVLTCVAWGADRKDAVLHSVMIIHMW